MVAPSARGARGRARRPARARSRSRRKRTGPSLWLALLPFAAVAAIAACAVKIRDEAPAGTSVEALRASALEPLDTVYVQSAGALDVENEYLPQVVCCENGAAHPEALKAQAVMARTYLYFRHFAEGLGTSAKPFKGTAVDQAYHCSTAVSRACRDAVSETRGEITTHVAASGTVIANASFYVDGPRPACLAKGTCACPKPPSNASLKPDDAPAGCDCLSFASQGAANPKYVTYNWPNRGESVTPSPIGSAANESNLGCASQNIQNCLGRAGWEYLDMLRFFYGQDIQLRHADGSVVAAGASDDADAGAPRGEPGADESAEGRAEDGPSAGTGTPGRGDRAPAARARASSDGVDAAAGCAFATSVRADGETGMLSAVGLLGLLLRRRSRGGSLRVLRSA